MSYPPDEHLLRALALETIRDNEGRNLALSPIHPHVCSDQGGMRLGIVACVVDVAGAMLAMRDIFPDRSATTSLSLQLHNAAREGPLVAVSSVLRRGSKQLVIEVGVYDGQGAETPEAGVRVASSLIGFSRIPYRGDHAEIPKMDTGPQRSTMAHPAARLDRPILERAGVRILDPDSGCVEVDNHDYVRNSFGTLNGGFVAVLAELSGELAARSVLGPALVAADLDLHYVGQSGNGPVRAQAERLRVGRDHCVSRVEIRDTGADHKLMAAGTVLACRLA